MSQLRIGILGAARIADLSIVGPATVTGHRLVAVAARDLGRAQEFAKKHGVDRAYPSYQDILDDPEVDVVYNPLANGLHGTWNLRALAAGKHLLTEKPAAANAAEARKVLDAASESGAVYMEGFHFPYHPLFQRVEELLEQRAIGEVRRIESHLAMPAPPESDPRWSVDLAGGATMDLGCYALASASLLGRFAGGPPAIASAKADERPGAPGVDERLTTDLAFPSGATGVAGSDMAADRWDFHITVTGSEGEIHVPDFPRPHEDDRLVLRRHGVEQVEHLGRRSSYTAQLEAFAGAVRTGTPVITDAVFSLQIAELIDHAYTAAGLPLRQPVDS